MLSIAYAGHRSTQLISTLQHDASRVLPEVKQ